MQHLRRATSVVVSAALLGGCGGLGGLGDIGDIFGGGGGGEIVAEVQSVDTRNRAIEVRTQQGDQGAIRYDDRTVVMYRGQQYPPTALERGDVIEAQLQQTAGGEYYAQHIDVLQSVQERTGSGGQTQSFDGTVGNIDVQNGIFEFRDAAGQSWIVQMPFNASSQDRYTFERLRRGDRVRFRGQVVAQGRITLSQFS
ncbi:MAG: hypothetical protein ACRELD_10185 [Longimicrobiales bacterium]